MPIDASIPLQVRQPTFQDPLELASKVLSIRSLQDRMALQGQERQINDEKLKQDRLATTKGELAAKDQEVVRGALMTATQKAQSENRTVKPDEVIAAALANGAGPDAIANLQKHYTEQDKALTEMQAARLPVEKYRNDQVIGLHQTALQLAQQHPASYATHWPQIHAQLSALDPEFGKQFKADEPPPPEALQVSNALHLTRSGQIAQIEEQRKADAERRAVEKHDVDVAKGQQEIISATQKAAGKEPIQPAQQAQIDATQAQRTETERHNAVTEGIAKGAERRNQAIYQQTYGEGSNEALRGVEPKLRTQATTQAQKAANEFQTAQKSADDIQTMISLVRSGNKAAGSGLPLVGVEALNALQGIKRINRTEVDQYEGAGSLLDQIKGKIGKLVVGNPIPKDVLDDIEQMHATLRKNSEKAYADKLGGINQNYHASFQPIKVAAPDESPKVEEWIRDKDGKLVKK